MLKSTSIILLGVALLTTYFLLSLQREIVQYEKSLRDRQMSVAIGWRNKWQARVVQHANENRFANSFTLHWNRAGSRLLTEFFPTLPISMNWASYDQLESQDRKKFLAEALAKPFSWDRVFAIGKLENANSHNLTPFETTLVDSESREAYRAIFAAMETPVDQAELTSQYRALGRVLVRADPEGRLEVMVPNKVDVQKYLERFLVDEHIKKGHILESPFEIDFDTRLGFSRQSNWYNVTLIITAFAFIILGIFMLFRFLRREKLKIQRRVGFLDQVVHELKTPLAGLKLHNQIIAKHGVDSESLKAIEGCVSTMDSLFNDIVLIQRSTSDVSYETVSASQFNDLLNLLLERYGERVHIESLARDPLEIDVRRFKLILDNVLKNAIRYGKNAAVRVHALERHVNVTVTDSGPGITKAEAKKIFQEFYRADFAKSSHVDGLGMGLAICRKLATEMGAKIYLENPGQAPAKFVISLMKGQDV